MDVHFCLFSQDSSHLLTQQQVGLDDADLQVPGRVRDVTQHLLWGSGVFDHSDRRALPGLDDAPAAQ